MKFKNLKFKNVLSYKAALLLAAVTLTSQFSFQPMALAAGAVNWSGSYFGVTKLHNDPTKPPKERSFFTVDTEAVPDGARLKVDLWQGKINEPVALALQIVINNGQGKYEPITFLQLSDFVKDNPHDYHSYREFNLTYEDLNAALKKVLPAQLQHIQIEPGTPLFLSGRWDDYSHNWGSIGRGGLFYMPEDTNVSSQESTKTSTSNLRRPTELDLSFQISVLQAMKYNTLDANGQSVGLKVGGEIQTRLESEGKFQVPLEQVSALKQKLFALADNQAEQLRVLGSDWTVSLVTRYLIKDPTTGDYLKDSEGYPKPDPMVDTAYDRPDSAGAKNDIVIRYRKTEQNGKGSWNLKPGIGKVNKEGIVNRIESAIDTTDEKPETISKFIDSRDPLNPFKVIREVIPGSTPSEFLIPSLVITDYRPKFKLKHKNGLVVEMSLDEMYVKSFRNGKEARACQIEMDVEHVSTNSTNQATFADSFSGLEVTVDPSKIAKVLSTYGKESFIDGRPVIHEQRDLEEKSPLRLKKKADFDLAESAIVALRNEYLGPNWLPAPNKAALAAFLLDHVSEKDASPSVKTLLSREKALAKAGLNVGPLFEKQSSAGSSSVVGLRCENILVK